MWGERCMVANMLNKQFFTCVIEKQESACKGYEALLAAIRERKDQ